MLCRIVSELQSSLRFFGTTFVLCCLHMKLLSPAISTFARLRLWSVEKWMENATAVQHQVWQDLISAGQYTEYGRKYNFSSIQSLSEFKKLVPVSEYEVFKPMIERMMQGEDNLLWNTPVSWFYTQ